jgi:hypothetical protein
MMAANNNNDNDNNNKTARLLAREGVRLRLSPDPPGLVAGVGSPHLNLTPFKYLPVIFVIFVIFIISLIAVISLLCYLFSSLRTLGPYAALYSLSS